LNSSDLKYSSAYVDSGRHMEGQLPLPKPRSKPPHPQQLEVVVLVRPVLQQQVEESPAMCEMKCAARSCAWFLAHSGF